jgi:N utilization substance protein B
MSDDNFETRATSRLLAVQALYQMEIAQTPLEVIIREFQDHRVENPLDGTEMPPADIAYFEFIIRGVMDYQTKIDRTIDGYLATNWRLSRLDSTLRAILRCGVCELMAEQKAPTGVVVSQYTDIAHAFFDGPEGGMTNALLDRLAKAVDEGRVSIGF